MAAITFPRDFPDALEFTAQPFRLVPQIAVSPSRAGRQYAQEIGEEVWMAEVSAVVMDDADLGIARAFFDTVSSTREFLFYDRKREYPLAYKDGWPAFDDVPDFNGNAVLLNVTAGVLADLADLPAGFVLSPGDYFAFDYGTESRALHRISAGGTADSGGELQVEVRPAIRPGWEGNGSDPERTIHLYRPAARMIVMPGSVSEQIQGGQLGRWSFTAIQTL